MGNALILEFFDTIPERQPDDHATEWRIRHRAACEHYRKQVSGRYFESSLIRLLVTTDDDRTRRAALLALGLTGNPSTVVADIAKFLRDSDEEVHEQAADALQRLWLRAGGEAAHQELRKALRKRDPNKQLAALNRLIESEPGYAEAHHQRAILHFRTESWHAAIADCEKTLELNPYHFGALTGMGRAMMRLGKNRSALRAFRQALRIDPGLAEVEEMVRTLEGRPSEPDA